MNKQEALQKISELQEYIKDLDKPKITMDMIVPGAVFIWDNPTAKDYVTVISGGGKFYLGGRWANPFSMFFAGGKYAFTQEELFNYLNDDYKFVGMQKTYIEEVTK